MKVMVGFRNSVNTLKNGNFDGNTAKCSASNSKENNKDTPH